MPSLKESTEWKYEEDDDDEDEDETLILDQPNTNCPTNKTNNSQATTNYNSNNQISVCNNTSAKNYSHKFATTTTTTTKSSLPRPRAVVTERQSDSLIRKKFNFNAIAKASNVFSYNTIIKDREFPNLASVSNLIDIIDERSRHRQFIDSFRLSNVNHRHLFSPSSSSSSSSYCSSTKIAANSCILYDPKSKTPTMDTSLGSLRNVQKNFKFLKNEKSKRPQSQEEIIEECKNSLNELIKASKWSHTFNGSSQFVNKNPNRICTSNVNEYTDLNTSLIEDNESKTTNSFTPTKLSPRSTLSIYNNCLIIDNNKQQQHQQQQQQSGSNTYDNIFNFNNGQAKGKMKKSHTLINQTFNDVSSATSMVNGGGVIQKKCLPTPTLSSSSPSSSQSSSSSTTNLTCIQIKNKSFNCNNNRPPSNNNDTKPIIDYEYVQFNSNDQFQPNSGKIKHLSLSLSHSKSTLNIKFIYLLNLFNSIFFLQQQNPTK